MDFRIFCLLMVLIFSINNNINNYIRYLVTRDCKLEEEEDDNNE